MYMFIFEDTGKFNFFDIVIVFADKLEKTWEAISKAKKLSEETVRTRFVLKRTLEIPEDSARKIWNQ